MSNNDTDKSDDSEDNYGDQYGLVPISETYAKIYAKIYADSKNINDYEIDVLNSDKKDILITSLIEYIHNNEIDKYLTNCDTESKIKIKERSLRTILRTVTKSGLIRSGLSRPSYDNVRSDIINEIKEIISEQIYREYIKDGGVPVRKHNFIGYQHINPKYPSNIICVDPIHISNKAVKLFDPCDSYIYKNFRIIREINSGAFGTIFEVQSSIDDKAYALKQIKYSDEQRAKWNNEARILSNLDHINIIKYHSSWTDHRVNLNIIKQTLNVDPDQMYLYIQMELCDIDLSKLLVQYSFNDRKYHVYYIFKQILIGIRYLHSNNIIHRDLKPSNILIKLNNDDIRIKIADFGCAKMIIDGKEITYDSDIDYHIENRQALDKDQCLLHIVPSSNCIGTDTYVAPEIERLEQYDYSADIYSLGIILFEMISDFNDQKHRNYIVKDIHKHLYPKTNQVHKIIYSMINNEHNMRPSIDILINEWNYRDVKRFFK